MTETETEQTAELLPPPPKRLGAKNTDPAQRWFKDIRGLAAEYGEAAIVTLAEIMEDKTAPASARVASATAILDRAFGKPKQEIEATVNVYDSLSITELRERVEARIAELAPRIGSPGDSGEPGEV